MTNLRKEEQVVATLRITGRSNNFQFVKKVKNMWTMRLKLQRKISQMVDLGQRKTTIDDDNGGIEFNVNFQSLGVTEKEGSDKKNLNNIFLKIYIIGTELIVNDSYSLEWTCHKL